MKDDQRRLLAAGFNGYLVKPFSIRELPAQVRACLDAARAPQGD
jgi:DNA-binding response OmpR family regulator